MGVFLKEIRFEHRPPEDRYPFNLPALHGLQALRLERTVTFLVGENGSGKSTFLQAVAEASGFNPEGGTRHALFETAAPTSRLRDHLRLSWFPKVAGGFFLRAESFFNVASYIDALERERPTGYRGYGGRSPHEQSHGEAFLSLFTDGFRRRRRALYLLDEPEAALSPKRQLALVRMFWEQEQAGISQFIVATHSPILLGYPDAALWSFDTMPMSPIRYEDTEHYLVTRRFLTARAAFLAELLAP
jgi:predicted ATPase